MYGKWALRLVEMRLWWLVCAFGEDMRSWWFALGGGSSERTCTFAHAPLSVVRLCGVAPVCTFGEDVRLWWCTLRDAFSAFNRLQRYARSPPQSLVSKTYSSYHLTTSYACPLTLASPFPPLLSIASIFSLMPITLPPLLSLLPLPLVLFLLPVAPILFFLLSPSIFPRFSCPKTIVAQSQ